MVWRLVLTLFLVSSLLLALVFGFDLWFRFRFRCWFWVSFYFPCWFRILFFGFTFALGLACFFSGKMCKHSSTAPAACIACAGGDRAIWGEHGLLSTHLYSFNSYVSIICPMRGSYTGQNLTVHGRGPTAFQNLTKPYLTEGPSCA